MSEDRADRLSRRRRERADSQDTDEQPTSTSSNTGNTDNTDNRRRTDNAGNTAHDESGEEEEQTVGPLRETAEEQMMRLTNDQYRDLHHVYNQLKTEYEYEYDNEFELNRHYFPLLLKLALPELRDLDAEDLRAELKDMD